MNNNEGLLRQISEYTQLLIKALKETNNANDRVKYQKHLASASIIFSSLIENDLKNLEIILEDEARSFGWDYLEGDLGEGVERKFLDLSSAIKKHHFK